MKKVKSLAILASVVTAIILGLWLDNYFYEAELKDIYKDYEKQSIPVDISGTVNVIRTIEGLEYRFTPKSEEMFKINETGQTIVILEHYWGEDSILNRELDGEMMRIQGLIWKLSGEYVTHPYSGLPLIIVKDLQILNEDYYIDQMPHIDIIGRVDYEGLPDTGVTPTHGFRYWFIPDEEELSKLGESRPDKLDLRGYNILSSELEGKKVRVQGKFIEDNYNFHVENDLVMLSNEFFGPVIWVTDIQVLD